MKPLRYLFGLVLITTTAFAQLPPMPTTVSEPAEEDVYGGWKPTAFQSNWIVQVHNDVEMTEADRTAFMATNRPPSNMVIPGIWPVIPEGARPFVVKAGPPVAGVNVPIDSTNTVAYSGDTEYVTNGNWILPADYTNRTAYLVRSADGESLVPVEVTQLFGYQPGMPYGRRIVGGTTNYYLLNTFAGPLQNPPPKPPERTMEFKVVFYDDLTDQPMGEVTANVNWDQGFMKTEMAPTETPQE